MCVVAYLYESSNAGPLPYCQNLQNLACGRILQNLTIREGLLMEDTLKRKREELAALEKQAKEESESAAIKKIQAILQFEFISRIKSITICTRRDLDRDDRGKRDFLAIEFDIARSIILSFESDQSGYGLYMRCSLRWKHAESKKNETEWFVLGSQAYDDDGLPKEYALLQNVFINDHGPLRESFGLDMSIFFAKLEIFIGMYLRLTGRECFCSDFRDIWFQALGKF